MLNENSLDSMWQEEALFLRQAIKERDEQIAVLTTQNEAMRKQLRLLCEIAELVDKQQVPESRL